MRTIRLSLVAIAIGVLLPLAGAAPSFADSSSPTLTSSVIPIPLNRFNIEIDGATRAGSPTVTAALLRWYAAHPAQVVGFLQFLHDYPAPAKKFYEWVQAHPVQATALYDALAAAP